jgi:hypothetical protein
MKRTRYRGIMKAWNKMNQQVKKAAARRRPGDKPSKGMRRFGVKA